MYTFLSYKLSYGFQCVQNVAYKVLSHSSWLATSYKHTHEPSTGTYWNRARVDILVWELPYYPRLSSVLSALTAWVSNATVAWTYIQHQELPSVVAAVKPFNHEGLCQCCMSNAAWHHITCITITSLCVCPMISREDVSAPTFEASQNKHLEVFKYLVKRHKSYAFTCGVCWVAR